MKGRHGKASEEKEEEEKEREGKGNPTPNINLRSPQMKHIDRIRKSRDHISSRKLATSEAALLAAQFKKMGLETPARGERI